MGFAIRLPDWNWQEDKPVHNWSEHHFVPDGAWWRATDGGARCTLLVRLGSD